jgi:prevent-host-death family protein
MTDVSIRDLRNKGGEIVDRAAHGEEITITRDGVPVAELRPIGTGRLSTTELIRRARQLPPMDPDQLRADINAIFDTSL